VGEVGQRLLRRGDLHRGRQDACCCCGGGWQRHPNHRRLHGRGHGECAGEGVHEVDDVGDEEPGRGGRGALAELGHGRKGLSALVRDYGKLHSWLRHGWPHAAEGRQAPRVPLCAQGHRQALLTCDAGQHGAHTDQVVSGGWAAQLSHEQAGRVLPRGEALWGGSARQWGGGKAMANGVAGCVGDSLRRRPGNASWTRTDWTAPPGEPSW
jgi:hypothetical protein